jgi:hypothetical protein
MISTQLIVKDSSLASLASLGQVFDCFIHEIFFIFSDLGKSTLATALAKELGLPVYYEPVIDNIYLADFYQDMKKYSFPLQIYLLNKRFKQQQQIIWEGKGGVQDRTIYEDSVFARMLRDSGHMEERDFRTYMELFSNMSNFMKKPNIIVHLDVSPEERFSLVLLCHSHPYFPPSFLPCSIQRKKNSNASTGLRVWDSS